MIYHAEILKWNWAKYNSGDLAEEIHAQEHAARTNVHFVSVFE